MLALAARAHAAWQAPRGNKAVAAGFDDVRAVARLALQHRREESIAGGPPVWVPQKVEDAIKKVLP
jgi:hypothetical protein